MDLSDVNLWLTRPGVVYRPDIEKFIECYVDADFDSGWTQEDSDNAENDMLCKGYLITYVGCPVLCCNNLQTEIALGTPGA